MQKAFDLAFDGYCLTKSFPGDERFGITAQVRRAAISISNNIVEGHGRARLVLYALRFLTTQPAVRFCAYQLFNCV